MKSILKIILFLLLLSPIALFADFITYSVNFSANDLIFSQIDNYDVVYLENSAISSKIGAPTLPKIAVKLLIPPGATATNVEIVSFEKVELPGKYNIYPAQPPQRISRQTQVDFILPDKEIYSSNNEYPGELFGSLHNGTKCGYRIVDFFVYPLRYIPADKKLVLYTKIVLKIHYDENTYPVRSVTKKQRDFWGREVEDLVDNPDLVPKWAPILSSEDEIGLSALPAGNYEYVIIAPNNSAWIDSLDTLAYWKTKKGVPAKIVNLQTDIYDNGDYTGDNQWQIKQFITDAVNTWGTIWVLIAADHGTDATNSIPRAAVWADNTLGDNINDLNCERFYEDLDNDWDYSGDGIYGHHNDGPGGGELDWLADVYVGRMMADNAADVGTYVRRILWFEKTPDNAFATRAIFASNQLADGAGCGSYGFGRSRTDDWQSNMPAAWTYPGNPTHPGYHVQQGINNWPGDGTFMGNSYYGAGYQFLGVAGHGSYTGFNGDNCGYGQFITSTEIDANYDPGMKCGISVSMACQAGGFEQSDCAAEHLYNKGNVGGGWNSHYGVGYLSSDDPSYMHQLSDGIVWQFFVQVFSATNKYHLGEAIAEDKDYFVAQVTDDCWNWCLKEWNTYGDPELPLWTADAGPDHMLVTHAATVPLGASVFSVNVKDDDGITNLQNALVTCWCKYDNTMYVRQYTNSSGNANLNVFPSLPVDTMWITVTKQNYIPYEGFAVIAAGAPDAPTLIQPFDNARIGDDASSTTPTLSWNVPSDGEGDPLDFKVQWANDIDFSSIVATIESKDNPTGFSCALPAPQGVGTCSYTVNSQGEGALSNGNTYWWRIAAYDGYNYGAWSEKRSFTIDTGLSDWDWFQTTQDQWNTDTLSNVITTVTGEVELATGVEEDAFGPESFEGTFLPTGWSKWAWPDNASANDWSQGDFASPSNTPYGSAAAIITYDTPNFTNRSMQTPQIDLTGYSGCYLQFALFRNGSWPDTMRVEVSTDGGGSGGTWFELAQYNPTNTPSCVWDIKTVDLSAYDNNSNVHIAFRYTQKDGNSGGVDYVRVRGTPGATSGTVTSTAIDYDDNPGVTSDWGTLSWSEDLTHGDITVDIQYWNGGSWVNTPLTGITDNTDYDISSLDPTTHNQIRLVGHLTDIGGTPILQDWTVKWVYGAPNNPPVVSNISIGGSGWRTGDIVVTYDLSDVENDPCNIDCEWWNGSIWQNATVTGPTSGITPGNGKTITWNSATDYAGEIAGTIKFRIRAQGTGWGSYDESTAFDLDNKAPVISATGTSASWACLSTSDIVLHGTDGGSGFATGCPRYSWVSMPTNCSQGSGPYADGSNPSAIPSGDNTLYVYGIDGVGHETSNSYSNKQDCTAPPDVTDLNSTSHPVLSHWYSANNVVLVWTDVNDTPSGTAGYRLVADNSATTDPTAGDDAVAQGIGTYTYNGLADGNNWYFHIRAIDNADNLSANSDHYGPVWIDNTPPTNVGCSSPADGSMVGTNPTLVGLVANDALAGLNATAYRFEIADNPGFAPVIETSEWQASNSWTPSAPLTAGQTYYWHIKARDAADTPNESAWSSAWSMNCKKYLFTVDGDGGKEYTTISSAVADVYNIWSTTAFDADVVVDVYTYSGGDYTDFVVPNTNLNPQSGARLVIKSADGESPIIDATGNNHGIYIDNVDYVTIRGFEIKNATLDGIRVRGSGENIIGYNMCHNNGETGIRIGEAANACANADVEHNLCYANNEHGIAIYGNSGNTTVKNNTCYNNGHETPGSPGGTGVTIFSEDWETGIDGWTMGAWTNTDNATYAHSISHFAHLTNANSTCTYTGIDVSGYTNLNISCWVMDVGNLEVNDCISGEYQLDGGGWIQFFSKCNDQNVYAQFGTSAPITGSYTTLDIRFTAINNNTAEHWCLDDILVTGDEPAIPASYTGCGLYVESGTNTLVQNNISIAKAGTGDQYYSMKTETGITISTSSGFNDYEENGNTYFIMQDGTGYNDIAVWNGTAYGNADSSVSPIFVNAGVDFHISSTNGSYHGGEWPPLTATAGVWTNDGTASPCIDAGTGSATNEPVPNGGITNQGCYGETPQASKSPSNVGVQLLVGNSSGPDYTNWALGMLTPAQVKIMDAADRVFVKNIGSVNIDVKISASPISWIYSDASGSDQCVLMALFNGTTVPTAIDYSTNYDTLGTNLRDAGTSPNGKFAGTADDGVDIPVSNGEEVYFYFEAPDPNTEPNQQTITVTIQAVEHIP